MCLEKIVSLPLLLRIAADTGFHPSLSKSSTIVSVLTNKYLSVTFGLVGASLNATGHNSFN